MHQCLGLSGAGVEDAACVPEDFQYVAVIWSLPVPPAYKPCIIPQAFHPDMLFDTDRKAVEGANGFLMFGVVFVKELRPYSCSFRKKLCDAIGLTESALYDRMTLRSSPALEQDRLV